jgi:hypothetical protein
MSRIAILRIEKEGVSVAAKIRIIFVMKLYSYFGVECVI